MGKKKRRTKKRIISKQAGVKAEEVTKANKQKAHPDTEIEEIAACKNRKKDKAKCENNGNRSEIGYILRLVMSVLLGMVFIYSGYALSNHENKAEETDWNSEKLMLFVVGDKPMQGAFVYISIDNEGRIRLRIMGKEFKDVIPVDSGAGNAEEDEAGASQLMDEGHLWIILHSQFPIEWNLESDAGEAENYRITLDGSMEQVKAIKSIELNGVDKYTLFQITYGGDHLGMAEINMQIPAENIMIRKNEYCIPNLPVIVNYYGDNLEDYRKDAYIVDSDFLKLTINEAPMYWVPLKINASYDSIDILEQPDIELSAVSPEPKDGYPLISWSAYHALFPYVQFYDRGWVQDTTTRNLVGGIFTGIGIDIFSLLVEFLIGRKGGNRL